MFNESDLNGVPERLLEICDELIARNLKIRLTGQLRIHVKSDKSSLRNLNKQVSLSIWSRRISITQ